VRIPFPERIPIERAAVFAIVLFVVQQLEGTALYFSAGCVVFLLAATFAFNTAGGLTRASGAYVFFYSVLVVVIGLCYKAFLGEPADSNLLDPHTTIEVYVGGVSAMLAAVVVSRRFARKTGVLQNLMKDSDMYRASVGCMVIGVGGPFLIALLGRSGAWLSTAFAQLDLLIPLGIVIGVMNEIRRSGGTRSLNLSVALVAIYYFVVYGVLVFSKQGMLIPLYCWLVPVCAMRFRLSALQAFSCLLVVFVIFQYLVPYSQYGRDFATGPQSISQRVAIATRLLEHPGDTKQKYEEGNSQSVGYYNTPQGFWDRLQFISVDDSLINITDQGKEFGLWPIKATFLNAIPHIFWPDKPAILFGNVYAHEIGILPEEDTTTGISFSPTAEAYHMDKWAGVLVAAPLVWFLLFIVFDSLLGDLRASPWGLLVIAQISHEAPEGALNGAVRLVTFGTEIFVFCAIFATWVAPVFATFVLGPDRRRFAPRRLVPTPRRLADALPPRPL
jgi:hypothetical protein